MDNEKMIELMTKMYSEMKAMKIEMQEGFNQVDERFNQADRRFNKVERRLNKVEDIVTHIEYDHGQKLEALFDGYVQNTQKLDRIEKQESQDEEFVLRSI